MSLVVSLLVLMVLALAGGGTVWLCVLAFVRRRQLPKVAMFLVWVIVAACLVGAIGTTLGILTALGAVGGVSEDPSQKAQILAGGISGAMSWMALGLLVWFPSIIALAVLLVLKREPTA